MLSCLYSSLDSYTIIKGFERCGITTYEMGSDDYRAKFDLTGCKWLLQNFNDIPNTNEWKTWEREDMILKKKYNSEREQSFIHVIEVQHYVPDPQDIYPKYQIYGDNMKLVSVSSCNPNVQLKLTDDQKQRVKQLSYENARRKYIKEHIEVQMNLIINMPIEPLIFPQRLGIIQSIDFLPDSFPSNMSESVKDSNPKYLDGYQNITRDIFDNMMNNQNYKRNNLGYFVMSEDFLSPVVNNVI